MAAVSFVLDREQIVYSDRFGWKNVSVFAQWIFRDRTVVWHGASC
jgi:hypothetical protein